MALLNPFPVENRTTRFLIFPKTESTPALVISDNKGMESSYKCPLCESKIVFKKCEDFYGHEHLYWAECSNKCGFETRRYFHFETVLSKLQ